MARRCGTARSRDPARLFSVSISINRAGVAPLVPDADGVVQGWVWDVTDEDMINLGGYEG
jgi:hypothetical protein